MGSTPNDMNNLSIQINKMVMNYIAKNKIRACNDVINNWVYLSIGRTNHSSMQKKCKRFVLVSCLQRGWTQWLPYVWTARGISLLKRAMLGSGGGSSIPWKSLSNSISAHRLGIMLAVISLIDQDESHSLCRSVTRCDENGTWILWSTSFRSFCVLCDHEKHRLKQSLERVIQENITAKGSQNQVKRKPHTTRDGKITRIKLRKFRQIMGFTM